MRKSPARIQVFNAVESRDAEAGRTRIAVDLEAVVRAAQQSRRLTGKLNDVVERVGQCHIGEGVGALAQGETDGGAQRRHAARIVGEEFLVAAGGSAARQRLGRGGIVVPHRMVQSADEGDAIDDPRGQRQVLAEADSRDRGGDGAIFPADLGRRIGLGIERIEVARTAIIKHEDAGSDCLGRLGWRCGSRTGQTGEAATEGAAPYQELTAGAIEEIVHARCFLTSLVQYAHIVFSTRLRFDHKTTVVHVSNLHKITLNVANFPSQVNRH